MTLADANGSYLLELGLLFFAIYGTKTIRLLLFVSGIAKKIEFRDFRSGGAGGVTEILDIAHEMAQDLFKVGVMDAIMVHTVDALCLPSKSSLTPEDIRRNDSMHKKGIKTHEKEIP